MSIKVSMLKRSIRPRMRSLTRGWVTPRSLAASPCFSSRAAIAFWRLSIRSERTLRCSASSGGKPRSRNTLPVDRVGFTFFTDHLSLSARPLLEQQAQAMPGEIEVLPRSRKASRSEEHTSELQSRLHLVCRLLLEKKKKQQQKTRRCVSSRLKASSARV